MGNLVLKELRQNLPWFAIGFIAMLYVIRPFFVTGFSGSLLPLQFSHYYGSSEFSPILSLTQSAFLMALAVFASVCGLALGLLQTFPEEGAGTYAFLLARPTGRLKVVGAKLAVGALLYFLATGLPFCWAIYWTSVPGHFACPFRFYMSYPGFMVIGAGFAFYLGAFLTGVRPARWFGSRLVGVAAAWAGAPVLCAFAWLSAYSYEINRYEFFNASVMSLISIISIASLLVLVALFVWAILASFMEREF